MKYLITIFLLSIGTITLGFAQSEEKKSSTIQELRSFKPQLSDSINSWNLGKSDTFLLDSMDVFIPRGLFQERILSITPSILEIPSSSIYALPDAQSRMPVVTFDGSVNYTILRKKF